MNRISLDYIPEPTEYADSFNISQIALFNLYLKTKPTFVLDIGTWEGTSALIAADCMDRNGVDGTVVTLDIVKHVAQISHPKVVQLQVYPYSNDVFAPYAWARDKEKLLEGWEQFDEAFDRNTLLLEDCMFEHNIDLFDCAYVDGDHTELGFMNDMHIVEQFVKFPHLVVLDDVFGGAAYCDGCAKVYAEVIKKTWKFYDFDDGGWPEYKEPRPGVIGYPRMAMVWKEIV